ncbi:MAG: SulP family inorganic anion transporter [Actinomycetota bacterium]
MTAAPERSGPRPLSWRRGYDGATLRADAIAGLTVAVMLVPQSMAYAALAGMPPVTGLYASIVPLLVYALLGTSGQLAVGPVAMTALLTASAVAPLAEGDPSRYAALAGLLALLAGAIQLGLGLLRAGVLVSFLSHAVIVGFTGGAAILIGASQLRDALGVDAARADALPGTLAGLAGAVDETHLPTLAFTVVAVLALFALKRLAPRLPGPLLVVAAAVAVAATLDTGTRVLGEVPAGLPLPSLPAVSVDDAVALLPAALAIAVISYAEGISVAKALAARARQRVGEDAELVAVGAANLAAGLFAAFPVAGGFSRSAVAADAGARTPASGAIAAVTVAVVAAVLTPLLSSLPYAVLAAVVLVAVAGLVDVREARRVLRTDRAEGGALAVTFLGTILLGVEIGLLLGVVSSLGVLLWRVSRPHITELGRVEGTTLLRSTARWPTHRDPRAAVLRVDGPLHFADAAQVADALRALPASRPELAAVILDASAVSGLDASAAHEVARALSELDDAGVEVHLATVRGPVRDVLDRADEGGLVDRGRWHATVEDAVLAVVEPPSPLLTPTPQEHAPAELV